MFELVPDASLANAFEMICYLFTLIFVFASYLLTVRV